MKTSGTPLAELERLHDGSLVENSLKAWQALIKALEKEEEVMKMVIDIEPLLIRQSLPTSRLPNI